MFWKIYTSRRTHESQHTALFDVILILDMHYKISSLRPVHTLE